MYGFIEQIVSKVDAFQEEFGRRVKFPKQVKGYFRFHGAEYRGADRRRRTATTYKPKMEKENRFTRAYVSSSERECSQCCPRFCVYPIYPGYLYDFFYIYKRNQNVKFHFQMD